MAVLISGGTGFVGLNLAEALLARGEHVVLVGLDAPPAAAIARFATSPGRLTPEVADVRDRAAFAALLRRHQVDRLFPFAAVTSGPERERDHPESVIEVNLLGLVSQLRAARDTGVRRIVVPSSSAVYGESAYDHATMDEATTPCVPTGIYGITKYAVERTGLQLAGLWDLDVVAVRIGAVFGPWERDTGGRDTLSPYWKVARLALAGETAVLPSVLPSYAYVYARDAAPALLHLLDIHDPPHRVYNVCSGTDWGAVLTHWCDCLAAALPRFEWRQSAEPAEVNVRLGDTRPRGRMDIARLVASGWSPRYLHGAAFADYRDWLLANPGSD